MSDNLQYTITADDGPLRQTMDRVKDQFSGLNAHVGNMTAGIQSSLGKLQGGLIAVAGLLAGGKLFSDSTRNAAAYDQQVAGLARTMGMTVAEASRVNVTLKAIGKTSDDLTSASMKLLRQVNANEAGLNALGLKTRDSSGQLLSMMQLLQGGLGVLRSYQEGADRDAVALQMFGKSAQEVMGLQKLTNEELARGAEMAEKYGLVVDGKNVEAAKKFKRAQDELKIASEALSIKIGNLLIPTLNKLAEVAMVDIPAAFAAAGRSFNDWADDVVNRAEPIRQSLHRMVAGVEDLLDKIRPQWLIDMKKQQAATQEAVMGEKFEGARDARREAARFDRQAAANRETPPAGRRLPPPGAGSKPDSQMDQWEQLLNAQKQAHERLNVENGTFYEFSKQRELDFWQSKLAIANKGNGDAAKVEAKVLSATQEIRKSAFEARVAEMRREEVEAEKNFAVKLDLARRELVLIEQAHGAESKQAEDARRHIAELENQARDQRRELRQMEIGETAAAKQHEIELERQKLRVLEELGLADHAQVLQAEDQFEQRRYQIQQEALQQRLQMLDPDKNPVEAARLQEQMLELERQYQLRLGQIRQQAAMENSRYTLQAVQGIEQGMARVLSQIGTQIRTIGQLIRSVFQVLLQTVVSILAQIAAKWIAQQIMMRVAEKASALSAITAEAGKAGAAGTASWAGAPWPINVGAPAFGAAMSAAAMAYAPMASASQGFDIPAGVNPVTQLHEREMVLPQPQADVIRDLAAGGGGGAQLPPVAIYALDGASVKRVLMDNPEALAEAFKQAHRRGHM